MIENVKLHEDLLSRGYKYWKNESNRTFKETDILYQKCIKDDIGKRYYIDIWYYPNKIWPNGQITKESCQIEAHFYDVFSESLFSIKTDQSIDAAEHLIERLWLSERCGYYEKFH